MEQITVALLLSLDNTNIIDIRTPSNYQLGHLPKAKNIPFNVLYNMSEMYLQKDKIYYIYCAYGIMSIKLCKHLKENNYKVVDVIGGYQAYQKYLKRWS
ncbi:MAG: rhodanese-like domain-containing protein [Bacilli bacterium]